MIYPVYCAALTMTRATNNMHI